MSLSPSPRMSAHVAASLKKGRRPSAACVLALILLLPFIAVMFGCASGSQGLPSGFKVTPVSSLNVLVTPLPPAVAGQPYTTAISVTGGNPPYGCSASTAPTGSLNGLPPGLTVTSTPAGCTISGTPLANDNGAYIVGLSVSDTTVPPQIATATFTLTVQPPFTFVNFVPGSGEVGHPFSQTFQVMGGVGALSACSLSPAVPGLSTSFTATSCTISGTPTATFGPANITLTGKDTGNPSTPQSTTMNTAMLTVVPALMVDAFVLGTGEVGSAYNQVLTTTAGTGLAPLTNCSFNPALPAGLTATANGTTCVVSGTPTAAFPATNVTLTATDSGSTSTAPVSAQGNSSLTVLQRVSLAPFTLGNGEVNAAYSQSIAIQNGNAPFTCSLDPSTALPAGLAVTTNGTNCVVSGTPTAAVAAAPVKINVVDTPPSGSSGGGMASGMSNLTILAQVTLAAFTLGNGEVNASYVHLGIPISNGSAPYVSCAFVGAAPAGLTVAINAGKTGCDVTGTPTATFGPATVTIAVTDTPPSASSAAGANQTTSTSALQIFAQVTLAAFALGNGEVGAAYAHLGIAISNGNLPYAACAFVGPAPAGLTVGLNGSGTACDVTGTPTAVFAAATVRIMVTDTAPSADSAAGTNTVANQTSTATIQIFPQVTLAAFALGNGEVGAPYSHLGIAISNGNTPYAACAFVGPTPAGLTVGLNGGGTACDVTGTPTAQFGPATVRIMVTDTAPSADSAAGTNTVANQTSTATIQIFLRVTLAPFTLLPGEVNAAYSHLGIPISNGNPPYVSCAFSSAAPAGLTVAINAGLTACDVTGTPTAVFGPANVSIMVTDTPPSADSVAGSNTTTSSATLTILPALTINGNPSSALTPFSLGDGEQFAGYKNQTAIVIGGGTGTYTCVIATLATGLTASAVGNTCVVTGAGTATPPDIPASNATNLFTGPITLTVTDAAPPSADSVAGVIAPQSTSFQIFPAVTFGGFVLGNGVQNQAFNQTGPPAFASGNTAQAYTCTFTGTIPAALKTQWNGSAPPSAACNVVGAGGGNIATTTFGPAQVTIQVKDTPRSADQTTPSMATAASQANFTIFPPLTVKPPAVVPNGLVGYAYPSTTFTATGGLSNGTSVTWTGPGGSTTLCNPPAGTGLPPTLTLSSTGVLSGSTSTGGIYTFQICVEDNAGTGTTSTNPAGANSAVITIRVLGNLVFATGLNSGTVEVADASSKTYVGSVPLPGGTGSNPFGIAVTADGSTAFAVGETTNTLYPVDSVLAATSPATAAGTPVLLTPSCAFPTQAATSPDATQPGHDRIYVICSGGVAVLTTGVGTASNLTFISLGNSPAGIAIAPDNSSAFVTLEGTNQLVVINNTLPVPAVSGTFNLDPAMDEAFQITVVSHGASTYAYIGKIGTGTSGQEGVEVVDVTSGTPSHVTNIPLGANPFPYALAADPLQSRVFVPLLGTTQFAVLDNSQSPPVQFPGSPFNLPDPAVAGTDTAAGVTVPPTASGAFPFQAYFGALSQNTLDLIDDNAVAPFIAKDPASPLAVAGIEPAFLASVPVPSAGFGLATTKMPDGIAGRSYDLFSVIRSGVAPFTCSANGLPGGLTVSPTAVAVTSGPLAGKLACEISGTAPGATTATVMLMVTDSESSPQTVTATFSFNVRPEFSINTSNPTPLPVGVVGRTYGSGAQTAPLINTTVSSTVGNSPLTLCSLSGMGGNGTLATALSGATSCSLSSAAALTANETDNLVFTATDTPIMDTLTGLVVVPAKAIQSGAVQFPLTVNAALAVGTGLGAIPAWTVNATNPYPAQTVTTTGGVPTTVTCALTTYLGNGLSAAVLPPGSNMCSLTGTPTLVTGGTTLTIALMDAGNSAVPASGTVFTSSTLVVNAKATLTTLEAAFTDGVSNTDTNGGADDRPYSVTASASGGTSTLTLGNTGLNTANCVGLTLTSTPTAGTVNGNVSGNPSISVTAPSTATCSFNLTVTDITGTTTTSPYTITIHPPLRLTFAPNSGFGVGVVNQPFSQTLTATGGLSPLTSCSASGVPGTLTTAFTASTCTLSGTPAATFSGTAMISVMDSTTTATPAKDTVTASSALTINNPIAISVPARIINGLNGFAYPGSATPATAVRYSASGGTGSAVTFTAAANAAGAACGAQGSAGTFPSGLTFTNQTGTTADLTGTPTTGASTLFSFPICAVDGGSASTAAYAVNTGANVNLAVFAPTAYAAGTGGNTLEAFTTSNAATPNTALASITLSSTPDGIAVTPDGRFAIVAEHGPDQIDVIDTISNAAIAGSPFSLGGGASNCATPSGVAADASFVYVACQGGTNEVLVLSAATLTSGGGIAASKLTEIAAPGTAPDSISFNTADTRAYVTLNATNQVMIIDNTTNPPGIIGTFALPAATDSPRGIAVLQNSANSKDYAYVAKQAAPGSTIAFEAASNSPTCQSTSDGSAGSVSCAVHSVASGAGNTILVFVSTDPATGLQSVADDAGNTYTQIPGCVSNDGGAQMECWATAPNAATNYKTITASLTGGGTANIVVSVVEYSGVQSFGTVQTKQEATTATPSISLNTQDNNNFCVAGFTEESMRTIVMGTGTLRTTRSITGTGAGTSVSGAAADNTTATPSACTVSVGNNPSAARSWVEVLVELRSQTPPAVDVVDVSTDTLSTVTSVTEPSNSGPFGVAGISATPSARAYVTLPGTNQFDVIDNTAATPASIAGSPFNLPDPAAAATAVGPTGVVLPPSTTSPVQAYFTFNLTGQIGIIDNNTPPSINATAPFSLTGGAGSNPTRVAAIPIPR